MAIIKLPYTDVGGIPVVYDSGRGVIEQDPDWVARYAAGFAPNVYGPSDVFVEGATVVSYSQALARATGSAASGGGGSGGTSGGTTPTVSVAKALETTISELIGALMRPIWPGDKNSIPTGLVVLGGVVAYKALLKGGKRR